MPQDENTETAASFEIDSVSQGVAELAAERRPQVVAVWTATCVLIAGIFFFFYFVLDDHAIVSLNANDGSLFLALIPLIIPAILYARLAGQARRQMVVQIAGSFGYVYETNAPFESVSGAIFSRGYGRTIYDIMSGMYESYPVRMFSYDYTVQEGKHSRTYTNTVCELTYSAPLPHILLLRRGYLGIVSDVDTFFGMNGLQKIQLEGDFGKYFDLFIDANAQMQVREIFEPDVMQDLVARFAEHDIEIKDSKIYLLEPGQFSTRAEYMALHELMKSLMDKLIRGLHSAAEDQTSLSS